MASQLQERLSTGRRSFVAGIAALFTTKVERPERTFAHCLSKGDMAGYEMAVYCV
jgi:hypothetical protein